MPSQFDRLPNSRAGVSAWRCWDASQQFPFSVSLFFQFPFRSHNSLSHSHFSSDWFLTFSLTTLKIFSLILFMNNPLMTVKPNIPVQAASHPLDQHVWVEAGNDFVGLHDTMMATEAGMEKGRFQQKHSQKKARICSMQVFLFVVNESLGRSLTFPTWFMLHGLWRWRTTFLQNGRLSRSRGGGGGDVGGNFRWVHWWLPFKKKHEKETWEIARSVAKWSIQNDGFLHTFCCCPHQSINMVVLPISASQLRAIKTAWLCNRYMLLSGKSFCDREKILYFCTFLERADMHIWAWTHSASPERQSLVMTFRPNTPSPSLFLQLSDSTRGQCLCQMGLVRITSWYPDFNGSHFGLPPSEIHRMTRLPPKIVWTMTYSHWPHFVHIFFTRPVP